MVLKLVTTEILPLETAAQINVKSKHFPNAPVLVLTLALFVEMVSKMGLKHVMIVTLHLQTDAHLVVMSNHPIHA